MLAEDQCTLMETCNSNESNRGLKNCYIRNHTEVYSTNETLQNNSNSNFICLDAYGEKVAHGKHLIGHTCTGRWNQQFHFHPINHTLFLQIPRIINDIRNQINATTEYCLGKDEDNYIIFTGCDSHSFDNLLTFQLPLHTKQ